MQASMYVSIHPSSGEIPHCQKRGHQPGNQRPVQASPILRFEWICVKPSSSTFPNWVQIPHMFPD